MSIIYFLVDFSGFENFNKFEFALSWALATSGFENFPR